jgi:virginiamycin B lyase
MTPGAIAPGPGGVWFDDNTQVARMDAGGNAITYPATTDGRGITAGPDGNIWFTDGLTTDGLTNGAIGRLVPSSGQITQFPVLKGLDFGDIAAGPDGALWFTGQTGNIGWLGRITLSGQVTLHELTGRFSQPAGIVAGRDGNMWFVDTNANTVGRIDLKAAVKPNAGKSCKSSTHKRRGAKACKKPRQKAALRSVRW